MNIIEFFDPYNIDHIKAYDYLSKNGTWPDGFLPNDITFNACWSLDLPMKLTRAWVEHVTKFKVT